MIYTNKNDGRLEKFPTRLEAESAAKRRAHQNADGEPVFILETIAVAQRPVPDVELVELS